MSRSREGIDLKRIQTGFFLVHLDRKKAVSTHTLTPPPTHPSLMESKSSIIQD